VCWTGYCYRPEADDEVCDKIATKNQEWRKYLKTFLARILAASLALAIVPVLSVAGIAIGLLYYNLTHTIPDPVARGDDLGNGFASMLGLVIGFFFSVPIGILVYRFLARKLLVLVRQSKSV
jgi:hypothetical protein